jgi:hypothetical protein
MTTDTPRWVRKQLERDRLQAHRKSASRPAPIPTRKPLTGQRDLFPDSAPDAEPQAAATEQALAEFEAERRELSNGHADEVPF